MPVLHRGGGPAKRYLPAHINLFLSEGYAPLRSGDKLLYHSHGLHTQMQQTVANDPSKVQADMPVRSLIADLTKCQLKEIAAVHKIAVPNRSVIKDLVSAVINHNCHCEPTVFVFEVLKDAADTLAATHRARNAEYKVRIKAKAKRKYKTSDALRAQRKLNRISARKRKGKLGSSSAAAEEVKFPPVPADQTLRHAVISDMCGDFASNAFEESGCAVCGRLCRLNELTSLKELDIDWNLLAAKGVTRKERFTLADPVSEIEGPVLAEGCGHVCTDCEAKLIVGVTPTHSLANHLTVATERSHLGRKDDDRESAT
jgi:hypothetical protein